MHWGSAAQLIFRYNCTYVYNVNISYSTRTRTLTHQYMHRQVNTHLDTLLDIKDTQRLAETHIRNAHAQARKKERRKK